MLIDRFRYKETLTALWHKVFGDSYSYIELIFNKALEDSVICFAETKGNEVLSAFYLLRSNLIYNGKSYNGYYLYAAATDEKYRGKGYMSELIKEAQIYCEKEGYSFISLVPSEESLYSYYSRFGFLKAMYCVDIDDVITENLVNITSDEYYKSRVNFKGNKVIFDEKAFIYAAACLKEYGYDFYSYEGGILIKDSDGEIIEKLNLDENKSDDSKKYPFGMLYPIDSELKTDFRYTDIYMNIALD